MPLNAVISSNSFSSDETIEFSGSIFEITGVKFGSGVKKKIKLNIKIAKTKLANGPPNIINALCHFGFDSNVFFSWSSVNSLFVSGSAKNIFSEIIET